METSIEKEKQKVLERIKKSKNLYALLESARDVLPTEDVVSALIPNAKEYRSKLIGTAKGEQYKASVYKEMMSKTRVYKGLEKEVDTNPEDQFYYRVDDGDGEFDRILRIPEYYTDYDVIMAALQSIAVASLSIKKLFQLVEVQEIVRDEANNRYFVLEVPREGIITFNEIWNEREKVEFTKKALDTLVFLQSAMNYRHNDFTYYNVVWDTKMQQIVVEFSLVTEWDTESPSRMPASYDGATLILSIVTESDFVPFWLDELACSVTREYKEAARKKYADNIELWYYWDTQYRLVKGEYLSVPSIREFSTTTVESCTPSKLLGMLKIYMDSRKRKSVEEQKEPPKRPKFGLAALKL